MNKDEKIRAEVERRYNYHKDHADDYAGTEHFWKADEDRELLSFIDSMQEEPKNFDEAIQECDDVRYNEDLGCRVNLSQLKRVAKKEATGKLKECIDNITDESLAKARKQLQEEPVSEDLEKVVKDYRDKYWYPDDIDKFMGFANHIAQWQKQQDEGYTKSMYKVGINTGKELMEQQMMAKAVDSTIAIPYQNGYGGYTQLVDSKEGLPFGENLKVLVIKE